MKLPQFPLRELRWLVLLAALIFPTAVNAQWATTHCEHDWTITVGEHRYGLQQVVQLPGENRVTHIHLGRSSVRTNLRAAPVAALVIVPLGVLAIAVVVGIGMLRRGRS